jgi:hypothetical protein
MRLFANTLAATIDGSNNVIIARDNRLVGAAVDLTLGTPWDVQRTESGAIRSDGVGSALCRTSPIGADTALNRGLQVAACLPLSLGAPPPGPDYVRYGLAVFAFTVAVAILLVATLWNTTRHLLPRSATADVPQEHPLSAGE